MEFDRTTTQSAQSWNLREKRKRKTKTEEMAIGKGFQLGLNRNEKKEIGKRRFAASRRWNRENASHNARKRGITTKIDRKIQQLLRWRYLFRKHVCHNWIGFSLFFFFLFFLCHFLCFSASRWGSETKRTQRLYRSGFQFNLSWQSNVKDVRYLDSLNSF